VSATPPLLLCAVLLFGTVCGIVIGAHLTATGRLTGRRQDHANAPAPAALNAAPAAAVVAVLRQHAELATVLRELTAAAPADPAAPAALPVDVVRQLPAGGDR
jgi:hypothetical protein